MYLVFLADDGHTHVRKLPGKGRIRMLAHPSQLPLLCNAEDYVDAISTNQLDGRRNLTPDYVLERMEKCDAPSDRGGWRVLSDGEFKALEYAAYFRAAFPDNIVLVPMPRMFADVFVQHPILKAGIGFVTAGAYPIGLLYLLNDIYDIRRFSHPKHPLRAGRLRAHLCLVSPQRVLDLYKGMDPAVGSPAYRASVTIGSWCLSHILAADRERIESDPNLFLYHQYFAAFDVAAKEHSELTARAVAMWKATLKYVSFLYQLWLSAVSEHPFDAGRFFGCAKVAATFENYIEGLDTGLDISVPDCNVK
jgi:hypothetical protein